MTEYYNEPQVNIERKVGGGGTGEQGESDGVGAAAAGKIDIFTLNFQAPPMVTRNHIRCHTLIDFLE